MRRTLRRVWDNHSYFLMGILLFGTGAIGFTLSNPYEDTFSSGKGWLVFSELSIGVVHPTEDQWGIIILFLALFQWASMWFLSNVAWEVEKGNVREHGGLPNFRFARVVWFATSVLYMAMAVSAFLSNHWGIFQILLAVMAILSLRALVTVRQTIESAGD